MHLSEKQPKPILQITPLSNGRIVSSQVFATDLDSGLNGLIEYSILSGNQGEAFHMDALSGMVTANAILDYEFTNSYRSVPDSGPFCSFILLVANKIVALAMTSCYISLVVKCVSL